MIHQEKGSAQAHADPDASHSNSEGKSPFSLKPICKKNGVGEMTDGASAEGCQKSVGDIELPQGDYSARCGKTQGHEQRARRQDQSGTEAVKQGADHNHHQRIDHDKRREDRSHSTPLPLEVQDDANEEHGKRIPDPKKDGQGYKRNPPTIVQM
jgi:hypothetical protein